MARYSCAGPTGQVSRKGRDPGVGKAGLVENLRRTKSAYPVVLLVKQETKTFALMISPTCVDWILLCARLCAGH